MQTVLSKEVTGYGGYNRYVNKKGHPTNIQFNFERILSKNRTLHPYGWDTDIPIWNIKYTEDGYNYECVGCVTAFPLDGVNASITWNDDRYTISSDDPYKAFVEIVNLVTATYTEEENQAFYQQYGYN